MESEITTMSEHEEAFVASFIVPEKKARYRELLSSRKRRGKILEQLHHTLDFDHRFSQRLHNSEKWPDKLAKILRQKGAKDICHIISANKELDGKELPLDEATEAVLDYQFGSVICCSPKLAFYQPEAPASAYIFERK